MDLKINISNLYLGHSIHALPKGSNVKDISQGNSSKKSNRGVKGQGYFYRQAVYNYRKLKDLPWYLFTADQISDLIEHCIMQFDWICQKCQAFSLADVLLDIDLLLSTNEIKEIRVLQNCLQLTQLSVETLLDDNEMALQILGRMSHLEKRYPKTIGKVFLCFLFVKYSYQSYFAITNSVLYLACPPICPRLLCRNKGDLPSSMTKVVFV